MATLHWPIKWSVIWLYIVCLFLWCMGKTYAMILNFYLEYQNMSQNYKNGQTTQTSNVKTARLLWVKADFARIARARRASPHSRSDSSKSPSPLRRQPQRRSTNLPKLKIATFYATDVELWFNQIETQFALHQINDDDGRYSLTCAALSGEVASDVRDVLLQPFRSHKYESLKAILIERRGLTTPERVNKVISGERMGKDIPSRFLRRLQKTAGFGTKAVVGKAAIRQAFIRQMPASIRAHLATQPDSATLESLAVLADRALASEADVEESKPGVRK